MATSLHPMESVRRTASATAKPITAFLLRFAAQTQITARSVLRPLQTARMMSVLANMSDQQIAEIGISRSDIPQYADRLMSEK